MPRRQKCTVERGQRWNVLGSSVKKDYQRRCGRSPVTDPPWRDRATGLTEGLQNHGRPTVGCFGGVRDPRRALIDLFPLLPYSPPACSYSPRRGFAAR